LHRQFRELPHVRIISLDSNDSPEAGIKQTRLEQKKCHQKDVHQYGNDQRLSTLWGNLEFGILFK
jgi:hypothetical protein